MSDWQAAPKACPQTETPVAFCTVSQLRRDASTHTGRMCVCTSGQAKIWTHRHRHTWWCQCCSLEEGRQTSSGCIVSLSPSVLTAQNTHQHKTGGVQRHAKTHQCQRTSLPTSNIQSSQWNFESPSLCSVSRRFLTSLPLQITILWTKYVLFNTVNENCRLKHQHHSETCPVCCWWRAWLISGALQYKEASCATPPNGHLEKWLWVTKSKWVNEWENEWIKRQASSKTLFKKSLS